MRPTQSARGGREGGMVQGQSTTLAKYRSQSKDLRLMSGFSEVIDDGIGMPEVVLSGAFLDFGKSFWQSDRVASLYPGLVSDPDFRPTGRFGIGFYASFIIGQNVKVLTRPFNADDR